MFVAVWAAGLYVVQTRNFSVIRRKKSPRWTLRFWSAERQRFVDKTSPFRVDEPQGFRKALALARKLSEEAQPGRTSGEDESWDRWVEKFVDDRYRGSCRTLTRYLGAWEQWRTFLELKRIGIPRALGYQEVLGFVEWRSAQVKKSSGKRVSRNTALCDVRVMAVIMREAVRRGFADYNHCEKLGIRKDPPKQKPEMTDAEIALIRAALDSRPEWMRISFEIALHQGCRLSETSLPLSQVDLTRETITFFAKGRGNGLKNVFTTQLHPRLRALFARLAMDGRERSCILPVMAAKEWHSFFREIRLPHLCFHSTRVTVITRMAREGVPIAQAMRYVGHASEAIHRIYQRLAAPDCGPAIKAIDYGDDEKPQTGDFDRAKPGSFAA